MLADRMVLLDHLTRGRVMFGVGPGALPSDAFMMGIEVAQQRDMMEESFEAILALLAGEKPVNRATEWFTLSDARLQLRPYILPLLRVAVAAQVSPSGPRARGPVRLLAAVDRRDSRPVASTSSGRTGRSWKNRPRSSAPRRSPRTGGWSDRSTSPRPRSRPTRTCISASRSGSTTSGAWPPSRSAPRPTTRPNWPTP